jgi:hypothetical protein
MKLVTALLPLLVAGGGWSTFHAHDVTVRYPSTWHATSRPLTAVTSPAELFAVASFPFPSHPASNGCEPTGVLARLGSRGAFIAVIEYAGAVRRSDFPQRPAHFTLDRIGNYECFGRGYRILFRAAGRFFQAQVDFGRRATPATRAAALRVLDSFRAR